MTVFKRFEGRDWCMRRQPEYFRRKPTVDVIPNLDANVHAAGIALRSADNHRQSRLDVEARASDSITRVRQT